MTRLASRSLAGRSFNGRTSGSEPLNRGSTPCLPATGLPVLTGSSARPRSARLLRQRSESGGTARCKPGKRRNKVVRAISPSRRASAAPRQKCDPIPKATCLLGSRATSNVSGSGNCDSSWFADPRLTPTSSPRGIVTDPIVTSSRVIRGVANSTGLAYRRISSIADARSSGVSCMRILCSGCCIRVSAPVAIRWTVVSYPASSRRTTILTISSSVSLSPDSSARTSAVIKSSCGDARRRVTSPRI